MIANNSADYGAGIFLSGNSSLSAANCTIARNVARKMGGGLHSRNVPVITNTILWDNSASFEPEVYVYNGWPLITYSDVKGGWSGNGNIDAAPLFVDSASGDYHLTWDSPCRGTGDNSVVTASLDFEGDPRIAGSAVDMGADEFYYHLYHTGKSVPGGTVDLKFIGYPLAPVSLAWGYKILNQPYPTQHGDLHIWPLFWQGFIGRVSSDGVLTLPITISSSWNPGDHAPLRALLGPWGGGCSRLSNLDVVTVK